MTPPIIATLLLPDNVIRCTVGLFIFSLLSAVGTKIRLDTGIHHIAVVVTVILGIASTTAFLFLIDYTSRLLRPIFIVWRIGEEGIEVIETVYPDVAEARRVPDRQRQSLGPPGRIVEHVGTSAIVLAVNLRRLVTLARRADGIIEFVPRVGDFVAIGEPLFRLYGGATRIYDQLHRLLRLVEQRHLHEDALFDADEKVGDRSRSTGPTAHRHSLGGSPALRSVCGRALP